MLSPPPDPDALSRGERISHTSATSDLCDFLCEGSDEETASVSSGQWPDRPAHEAQIEDVASLLAAEELLERLILSLPQTAPCQELLERLKAAHA